MRLLALKMEFYYEQNRISCGNCEEYRLDEG